MNEPDPGSKGWDENWNETEPDGLPGDEVHVVASGPYLLYSLHDPSTQWIESDYTVELETWQ